MRFTDMADEMFGAAQGALPAGVRLATAKRGGVTITRVEIAREGLAKPRGRYVTLEMPSVSVLDERDAAVIETCAAELQALLPPEGPVLVLGVGNRRVTSDALGPRTVQKIFVTMGHFLFLVQCINRVVDIPRQCAVLPYGKNCRIGILCKLFCIRRHSHRRRIQNNVVHIGPACLQNPVENLTADCKRRLFQTITADSGIYVGILVFLKNAGCRLFSEDNLSEILSVFFRK